MATSYCVEVRKINRLTALVDDRMAVLVRMSRAVQDMQEKTHFRHVGMAHMAREQYNLSFPGELVFIIKREKDSLHEKER